VRSTRTPTPARAALEGGTDLAGKYKPRAWGNVQNVPPVLVDSASLIYQVNDGAISDVPAAYDRQIALVKGADYVSQSDMQTNAPAAGNYRVWKAGGFFRLGSTPAGTCTADVLGDASGAGYVNKAGDILQRVLLIAGIDSTLIDAAAFAQLNTTRRPSRASGRARRAHGRRLRRAAPRERAPSAASRARTSSPPRC
jgi:hypothetical protein